MALSSSRCSSHGHSPKARRQGWSRARRAVYSGIEERPMASERGETAGEDMPERSTASLFGRRAGADVGPVPSLAVGATVADAVALLGRSDSSAVVIVDAGQRPCGILTERDVTRRVALQGRADWPIERVMTRPVATIRDDEFLYRAVARMRARDPPSPGRRFRRTPRRAGHARRRARGHERQGAPPHGSARRRRGDRGPRAHQGGGGGHRRRSPRRGHGRAVDPRAPRRHQPRHPPPRSRARRRRDRRIGSWRAAGRVHGPCPRLGRPRREPPRSGSGQRLDPRRL
ncbi:MAG: CBS domain-containing protein [Alphaproteobacteria bacterium]|nr:CBS domain-containing protein [Alphaproteobacteria bacterium]